MHVCKFHMFVGVFKYSRQTTGSGCTAGLPIHVDKLLVSEGSLVLLSQGEKLLMQVFSQPGKVRELFYTLIMQRRIGREFDVGGGGGVDVPVC